MATAVGAYATLTTVKLRLGITDTTDDTLLQGFCDQANQIVETYTDRVFATRASYLGGLQSASNAGDTTVTLGTASGVSVNDVLMFGPVSGTHESASVASINGNSVTLQTGLVNSYASNSTVQRAYVFDGWDADSTGKMLPIPQGIVSMTSLEVCPTSAGQGGANETNVVWYTVPGSDFFLRPTPQERTPGWPAEEVWITNIPLATDITPSFYPGFANVRILGTLGWPATPDDVTQVALNVAVALYRARGAGGADSFTLDEATGRREYTRMLSWSDRMTLDRYKLKWIEIL